MDLAAASSGVLV